MLAAKRAEQTALAVLLCCLLLWDRLKSRPMSCAPLTSSKTSRVLSGLSTSTPPHTAPMHKTPTKWPHLLRGLIDKFSLYLSLSGGALSPASAWNYANKLITSPCRNIGHFTLLILQCKSASRSPVCSFCAA
jgi:hypothetical protein